MYHPEIQFELAKLRIAEDLRQAERDRLVRQAGASRSSGAIDSVPFRERVARVLGVAWPPLGARPSGAGA